MEGFPKSDHIYICRSLNINLYLFIQLKGNLQSLVAEHNIDVSKLQLATKEHADTTNAFSLMHKEIEQLRVEKYVNF